MGETELLAQLGSLARKSRARGHVISGPGDDAAVWRPPVGADLVVSQDCLVEGVDFRREWIAPHQLGRRALHVALSDLAASGAQAAYCLATLCAPGSTLLEDVLALQEGLCHAAAETGCPLLGGDVSDTSGPLTIDISVAGTVAPGRVLQRAEGRAGDLLFVTGVLGRAAAGLELLRHPSLRAAAGADADRWLAAQLDPTARLTEGRALVDAGVQCGADLSDGLLAEVSRTAADIGCGAEIWLDALPVDAALRRVFAGSWIGHAVAAGEDFELMGAASPDTFGLLRASWPSGLRPLTIVGRFVPGSGVVMLDSPGGSAMALPPITSRHYR